MEELEKSMKTVDGLLAKDTRLMIKDAIAIEKGGEKDEDIEMNENGEENENSEEDEDSAKTPRWTWTLRVTKIRQHPTSREAANR